MNSIVSLSFSDFLELCSFSYERKKEAIQDLIDKKDCYLFSELCEEDLINNSTGLRKLKSLDDCLKTYFEDYLVFTLEALPKAVEFLKLLKLYNSLKDDPVMFEKISLSLDMYNFMVSKELIP